MNIGKCDNNIIRMYPKMANRHGLITGATGTGKTVTLKVIAECFSEIGVPVFLQDIKGDLSGFIEEGSESSKFRERLDLLNIESIDFKTYPTTFWDIFGKNGHPVRTTVSDMGPLMLSRLLELNEVQSGILYTLFKLADDEGLLLLDFKDLSEMINYVLINSKALSNEYGNITKQSVGAIQRKLLVLEQEGVNHFFGEPALDITDLMAVDNLGRGMINVLDSSKLSTSPQLYSTFLLWLLSELFEELPEVGDMDKPRLVFFFNEAHLLFDDAPKYLMSKFEQIVKLIRSKGVGIYFITQNPLDIPDDILGQLGNRIQHALRAYTPKDQKAVKAAAETFRQNKNFDTEEVITQLGVGEALLSFLNDDGIPGVVERAYILPPKSKIGAANNDNVSRYISMSYLGNKYNQLFDRHSAYEELKGKAKKMKDQNEQYSIQDKRESKSKKDDDKREESDKAYKSSNKKSIIDMIAETQMKSRSRRSDSPVERMVKSAASSIGTQLGRQIIRGIMGSIAKSK